MKSEEEANAVVSWTSLAQHLPIEQLSLQQRPVHVSTTEPPSDMLGRLGSSQPLATLIKHHPVLLEDATESGTIELAVGSEIRATTLAAVLAAAAAAAAVAVAREDGDGSERVDGVAGRRESAVIVDLIQGGARTSLEADAEESFIL